MMKELALHVLDIAENSVRGEASHIVITITEDRRNNRFAMEIDDDGKGISPEILKTIKDPFTTTRTMRKVGLGIPFLNDTCRLCNGHLDMESTVGLGTRLRAEMEYNHIDRPPLGDMAATLMVLMSSHPDIAFTYRHIVDDVEFSEPNEFEISSGELEEILDGVPLTAPKVYRWVKTYLEENIRQCETGGTEF